MCTGLVRHCLCLHKFVWQSTSVYRYPSTHHSVMHYRIIQSIFLYYITDTSACRAESISTKDEDECTITSQNCVKVLGVSIDKHLTFNDHISSSCSKAARQLNAFARTSKHLNLDSRRVIHQSFILSNFNYCPLVWHFCGKTNNKKLEKIQERSLRILYNDYDSTYEDLLCNNRSSTLLLSRLKTLLLETFKSLRNTNAECLHDIFNP